MNYLDYIIIVSYIVGFLLIGKLFSKNESGQDYFLGGKSFGWFPLTLSTVATQLSAISFISAPAFVGLREAGGMVWLTYEFAVPLAMIFVMVILAPSFYKSGIISVYAYLEKRFDASTRILLSIIFQISRAFATSVMIYAIALILMSVLSIPMWQTIVIVGIVTMIYVYQGGMKAVVYGDMIQMVILLLGIVVCIGYGLSQLGGWDGFKAGLDTSRLTAVNFDSLGFQKGEQFGFWPMVLGGFFLYASYYGTDQSQVQRLLSAKNVKTVQLTLVGNGLIRFPITFSYCLMGLVIGTLALSQPDFIAKIPTDQPDLMIPIFIRDYLPHGIIGILIVAILSAAMSSLSSAINSLSAATVEDLISRKKELTEQQYMKYSHIAALCWGVVCLVLAFFAGDIAATVIEAINKIGSVFYGPILATFISAVAIKKVKAKGANIGLLAGVLVNMFLWLFVPDIFWFWWNAIGAIVTLGVAYISSSILGAPDKSVESSKHTLNIDISSSFKWSQIFVLLAYFLLIIVLSLTLSYWLI